MNPPMPLPYRDPARRVPCEVCPHCRRETHCYRFITPDGHWLETHHCRTHGDVAPLRSHVVNQAFVASLSAA